MWNNNDIILVEAIIPCQTLHCAAFIFIIIMSLNETMFIASTQVKLYPKKSSILAGSRDIAGLEPPHP